MTPQEAIELIKWTPLMRYEADLEEKSELGQALDMAIKALEKQIAKKIETRENVFLGHAQIPICPRCRVGFNSRHLGNYCLYCGQKFDYGE